MLSWWEIQPFVGVPTFSFLCVLRRRRYFSLERCRQIYVKTLILPWADNELVDKTRIKTYSLIQPSESIRHSRYIV